MIGVDFSRTAVYLRPCKADVGKQLNRLSLIVGEQMVQDPLCGTLFLFCNRERRILKALVWERNGFCLWQKRLEQDKFPM